MVNLFVVVLNWNRVELTLQCLQEIEKVGKKGIKISVVVVDNASHESIKKIINFSSKKFSYHFIKNTKNLGYAAGNNVGIEYALKRKADYILVLNNDVLLDKSLFESLVKNAQESSVGAVTPKIYFARGFEYHKDRYKKSDLGKIIWAVGGVIDWNNVYANNRGVDEVDRGQYDLADYVDFGTGACLLLKTSALKVTGIFDPRYFMYFEDVDLAMRMKTCGYKIKYAPRAIMWHQVSQSSGIGSNLNDYFLTRNRILFATLYAPLRARIAILRESFRFLVSGRVWQKRGVVDFFRQNFETGSWS